MKFFHQKGVGLFKKGIISIYKKIKDFFVFAFSLFSKLSRGERLIFFVVFLVLIALLIVESLKIYKNITVVSPAFGGQYTEVIYGEAKYFNPILVKGDAEKAVSQMIYSSLIKIDENYQPIPDLASSWEISNDGLVYTFYLRSDVFFHNGQLLNSNDILSTVTAIQDEANKSPLRDSWLNVVVGAPNSTTVTFTLNKPYGPFIYNCDLKILNAEDLLRENISSVNNGTGPYKFVKSTELENPNGLEVSLEANSQYFKGSPIISKAKFIICKNYTLDKETIKKQNINAVYGFSDELGGDFKKINFTAGRELILFLNTRNEPLNNLDTRKTILEEGKVSDSIKLDLVYLDAEMQKKCAENFKQQLIDKGFAVESKMLSSNDYVETINKKDYDLLLYGYNWSRDFDPYIFWHSSQMNNYNFSGYASKEDDIFLEDTRMILDYSEREQRYQQFFQKISDNALAKSFGLQNYQYYMSDEIKVVDSIKSHYGQPEERLSGVFEWYIKEKRIRKRD